MESSLRDRAKELEEVKVGSLYQQRFGEVCACCRMLQPWTSLLRATWNRNQFVNGPGVSATQANQNSDQSDFSPDFLMGIIADNLFFMYLNMIVKLWSLLQDLASWTAGCPCHAAFLEHGTRAERQRMGNMDAIAA